MEVFGETFAAHLDGRTGCPATGGGRGGPCLAAGPPSFGYLTRATAPRVEGRHPWRPPGLILSFRTAIPVTAPPFGAGGGTLLPAGSFPGAVAAHSMARIGYPSRMTQVLPFEFASLRCTVYGRSIAAKSPGRVNF